MAFLILFAGLALLALAIWLRRRGRRFLPVPLILLGVIGLVVGGVGVWYTHRLLPEAVTDQSLFQGVTYTRQVRSDPRPLVIHVVRVDLTAPGIGFLVTPQQPTEGRDLPARTVGQFVAEFGVQVAINANYFLPWWSNAPWDYYPHVGDPVDVLGGIASEGAVYGHNAADWHPLAIDAANHVALGWDAVPEQPYNLVSGQLLLDHGAAPANLTSDDYLTDLHPRTAVGVDAAGATLFLVVVDGRQPGYSEGISLPELADLLLDFGVYEALNLDGGGSTTLVIEGSDGAPQVLNSPIDNRIPGRERPVAAHLGVRALPLE